MNNPYPINQREQKLINLWVYFHAKIDPFSFYSKWGVTHEQIAAITGRSLSTVRCWFLQTEYRRTHTIWDERHLALMDFILDDFEKIPTQLVNKLVTNNEIIQVPTRHS